MKEGNTYSTTQQNKGRTLIWEAAECLTTALSLYSTTRAVPGGIPAAFSLEMTSSFINLSDFVVTCIQCSFPVEREDERGRGGVR